MIRRLQLIRNIGQFESVSQPAGLNFNRLTLIYGENGRGKTTIAAILASLATSTPSLILERQRLGTTNDPHAVIELDGQSTAVFQGGGWIGSRCDLAVFDDSFVDANVCSGLAVAVSHRQNLHELIIGAKGVELKARLQGYVDRIEQHNRDLRTKADAIPAGVSGSYTVEQFCSLQPIAEIEKAIESAERNLAALQQQEAIRSTGSIPALSLPAIDVDSLSILLSKDIGSLDKAAAALVQEHCSALGDGGEMWVADGVRRVQSGDIAAACPFCNRELSGASLYEHYRSYFGTAYRELKQEIAEAVTSFRKMHVDESPAAFERSVRVSSERRHFWSQFCDVPEIVVDTAEVARKWKAAREAVLSLLQVKQKSPLDVLDIPAETAAAISAYEAERDAVAKLSVAVEQARLAIDVVKEQAEAGNLSVVQADAARLKACRERQTKSVAEACTAYLTEKSAKAKTEELRDETKEALKSHRAAVFPAYQTAINEYLRKFNANFRLDAVQAADTRGGPTCTYGVLVNNEPVAIAVATTAVGSTPSFKTALSSGDRNTLALAFFMASLDQDPALVQKTVVIDDPITSLDDHRAVTTVQEIRRLLQRVSQVILLSHNKPFLCRVWDHVDQNERTSMEVTRFGSGSTLSPWDATQDCYTEHDRRSELLDSYKLQNGANGREVARTIRPHMEAFLRVAYPATFPPGSLLVLRYS